MKKAIALRELRQFSDFLDRAIRIPGTSQGIGLDPLIGLIPGGGDLLGAVLAGYIVFRSFQLGLPKKLLLIMTYNIVIDTVLGTVPIFGDLFDVLWKANVKNVDILESYLMDSEEEDITNINNYSDGDFRGKGCLIFTAVLFSILILILALIIILAITG
ncbi:MULTISPECIES: DUF4112 domain-containing protein [Arthrospira]|uniref:DUF4112 domain-containing protein n=1 Tax=Limnospira platensis NIES-46 TaxID=1236695 RepID=A0A5M3T463_LIMPL|nr:MULTISPECIES: DUF4112 domain-containing protein [Arthrospira]KDR56032.1 hypothetical protein APPUASWS_019445 [Arthrospira platensis str. Paraca]MBD2711471.1 DUF4112 domain-containing protein [Arthrospira platensis FACHB-835]MDF2212665.1 DUF4112 domain-containing protein [Arthrospira platensis NCB002]MDT9296152.1 DUF4112 domain-containing protein [Arthrospira platensis PCC 7345]QQW31672.1 DUF4112 domain-containing protein [Arthrospira sp. PCC 9108]BAI90993.1 hypothetical protein NIES39_H006